MDLYFSVGLPNGYTELLDGITFDPKLVSLSSNTGSSAGSIITAQVKGVGVDDQVTLYDSVNSVNMCQTSKVIAYGILECLTISQEIPTSITLSVQNTQTGDVFPCAASNPSNCLYVTFSSAQQMVVDIVNLVDSQTLTFTGDLFPTSDPCQAVFMNVFSDSCTVLSATSASAIFDKGVPTTSDDKTPELRFEAPDSSQHYAMPDQFAVIQNPLSVTATASGVVSSFAGGQKLQVTANGLTNDVISGRSEIRVCQKVCEIDEAMSTASSLYCTTPAIRTIKSNSEFTLSEDANQTGQLIYDGVTLVEASKTTDGQILPAIGTSTANCYIGARYSTGYVGVINEIAIFMDIFDSTTIVDQLIIEASSDNFATTVELTVIGEEIHEGWNYYELVDPNTDGTPKYQYYRVMSIAS